MGSQLVIDLTKRWISEFVIGLNLCPFARRVFDSGLIRYVATDTADADELLELLEQELRRLAAEPRSTVETALLIHPNVLTDFRDFNDFLAEADRRILSLELHGTIQIASFHPQYQFERTAADDAENFTNRSPFPMLHLLREASITEVAGDREVLLGIPERNLELMRKLGRERLQAKLRNLRNGI